MIEIIQKCHNENMLETNNKELIRKKNLHMLGN